MKALKPVSLAFSFISTQWRHVLFASPSVSLFLHKESLFRDLDNDIKEAALASIARPDLNQKTGAPLILLHHKVREVRTGPSEKFSRYQSK